MAVLYNWIGIIVFWTFICFIGFKALSFIFVEVINLLGRRFNNMWAFIEYLFYRKEFKEWVKDKERHPRMVKSEKQ